MVTFSCMDTSCWKINYWHSPIYSIDIMMDHSAEVWILFCQGSLCTKKAISPYQECKVKFPLNNNGCIPEQDCGIVL